MKHCITATLVFLALVILAYTFHTSATAQARPRQCAVPKDYGTVKFAVGGSVLNGFTYCSIGFEDTTGNFARVNYCVVSITITRQ